ncbi:hypothetical protein JTB14_037861 [Gonioctena quinquepunctata]|nr:hypothetical protein JTB14_037861 [Gonioctena quinquepunctata]
MLTFLVLWCESKGKIPGVHYFCSPWSITTSSTDSPRSFKRSHEDTSTDSEGNKGQIKRARREIKIRHNYSASPSNLLRKLKHANVRTTLAQKKVKVMKVKVDRLKKEVTSLKQILLALKRKELVSENGLEFLEKSITGVPLSLMKRTIEVRKRKLQGKKLRDKFSDDLKTFAMTLQFLSSKAYLRLCMNIDLKVLKGNCDILDDTTVLGVLNPQEKRNLTELCLDDLCVIKKYDIDYNDLVLEDERFVFEINVLPSLSLITENVVTHISGFVVKSVRKLLNCTVCLDSLAESDYTSINSNIGNIHRKDRCGLIKPSKDVIKICEYTEKKHRLKESPEMTTRTPANDKSCPPTKTAKPQLSEYNPAAETSKVILDQDQVLNIDNKYFQTMQNMQSIGTGMDSLVGIGPGTH